MASRYLVVSDLHVTDVEDHPDGWKYHKGSRYTFDEEFAQLLETFERDSTPGDALTLLFNGDIFDFDLVTAVPADPPWPVIANERRRGLRPTAGKSAWKLKTILADHPVFVRALATFLAHGHTLVYVMGNHDREFHFAEVQDALVEVLASSARDRGLGTEGWRVCFEPWFFYVPGEIYAEHGHQYDFYTSFRYILSPVVDHGGEARLALPMGNLSNRYLMSELGYFNPHTGDFILNLFSYLAHWVKYYAFTRHSLVFTWLFGSLAVLYRLLRTKRKLFMKRPDHEKMMVDHGVRNGLNEAQVRAIAGLKPPPITDRLFRLVREFWIDRVAISGLMVVGTIVLALTDIPLWIKLMVPLSTFPLLFLVYELIAQGESIFTVEHRIPEIAREIAKVTQVPLVTFGHTHVPRLLPLSDESTFVDSGTWAPMTNRSTRDLEPGYRNYLVVTCGEGPPVLHFASCPTGEKPGRFPQPIPAPDVGQRKAG